MADLESTLSGILSDPEAMEKIQELGKSLGLGNAPKESAPSSPFPSLSSLIQSNKTDSPDLAGKISTFLPILSKMNTEDETTTLLRALRPFLSKERQKRLDDAGKMLKIMHILPLISSGGLFS